MPAIGVTSAKDAKLTACLRRVREVGGSPLVLRPGMAPMNASPGLDRLLLTGGADVQPSLYGAPADPEAGVETDPSLDELEMGLLTRALEEDLPVLAICRGLQLLNVAFGGSLIQGIRGALGKHLGRGDGPTAGSWEFTAIRSARRRSRPGFSDSFMALVGAA